MCFFSPQAKADQPMEEEDKPEPGVAGPQVEEGPQGMDH